MNEKEGPTRKVIVFMSMTLDGVIQGPARPDEDRRNDFPYGGWAVPYVAMQSREALQALPEIGPLLLGRWTYEDLYDVWPKRAGDPMTERLNQMEKYVVSNTLREPLPWVNSALIQGDVAEAVAKLKAQSGKDIMVMGSGELIQTLMAHHLVDLYVLLIHPLVLGTGRRLFPEGLPYTRLQLVDAKPTPKGVVVASYRLAESENQ
jgi:dihydrofolate reductase